jgi:hypothetical protein
VFSVTVTECCISVQVAFKCVCVKPHYSIPSLDRPIGLQEVEAPRTSRNAHEGGDTVTHLCDNRKHMINVCVYRICQQTLIGD